MPIESIGDLSLVETIYEKRDRIAFIRRTQADGRGARGTLRRSRAGTGRSAAR